MAFFYSVLGKLGGGNRKMMNEPQRLDYQTNRTNNPAIIVHFVDYEEPINLCLQKVGIVISSFSPTFFPLLIVSLAVFLVSIFNLLEISGHNHSILQN